VLVAAVAAVALTIPATAGESTRGVTDNEIVIGTYTDLSGVTAAWGVNDLNAYRMAFDETGALTAPKRAGVETMPAPFSSYDPDARLDLDQVTETTRFSDNGVHSVAAQIFACPALRHWHQHPITLIGPSRELA
jgi:hypothetical protein